MNPLDTVASQEGLFNENIKQQDIIIPVYIGGTLLDEIIVDANKRENLRSGGR